MLNEPSSSLTSRQPYDPYAFRMTVWACIGFLATLLIPWTYDRWNLQDFNDAKANNQLLFRECASQILAAELLRQQTGQTEGVPSLAVPAFLLHSVANKRIISLDYVHQMERVESLQEGRRFLKFVGILFLLFATISYLLFKNVKWRSLRVPTIGGWFVTCILLVQLVGLPHTNYKFHIAFTVIYASLLSLSDLLLKYDLELPSRPEDTKDLTGYLSCLQYKHRFWSILFNVAVVTIIAVVLTTSFQAFNTACVVFGEGFVGFPLLGIGVAVCLALCGTLFGVLQPIRRHLARIELAMASGPQVK